MHSSGILRRRVAACHGGARRMSTVPRGLWAACMLSLGLPAVQAQTITTTAFVPAAIPVDHPGALLLLALALGIGVAWQLRRTQQPARLRSAALGGAALGLAGLAVWGDAVQAVPVELQQQFSQSAGQTQTVPVQAAATAPDGSPLDFLPVVYGNQAGAALRIADLTPGPWSTCFPLGIPAVLPTTAPRTGSRCAVGSAVAAGAACWVDVAQLCADGAAAERGSHPSVLQPDTASVAAGGQFGGNVLGNDADADGPLVVTRFVYEGTSHAAGAAPSVAGRGTFSLQASGAYSFAAAPDFSGPNPLVVHYFTQTGASSTLSITVQMPNSAPVASNQNLGTDQDMFVNGAVVASDPDGDPLSFSISGTPANGMVDLDTASGSFTYTPSTGFAGVDSFVITVSDGRGGTATSTITINVRAANRPPTAHNDAATVRQDESVTVAVRGNDTDPDGNALTVTNVTQGANGSVVIDLVTGNPVYTPHAGFVGTDHFTY
ncbi:MAG TPA: midcut-by-XrtH protein, partial [Pseudorhodoferax sp.]|nr:midcut-by-XrtH protein [Pseudorhodoferax sp.]